MLGRQPGKLLDAREVDIHGSKFYDLSYALAATPGQAHATRIGRESVYADPRPGDAVTLHLVMGVATRVDKREA